MFSIRLKIILLNALLFGATLAVFAMVLYKSVEHNSLARLDSQLAQYGAGFNRGLAGEFIKDGSYDTTEINELRAEGPKGVRYGLLDEKNRLLVGTLPQPVEGKKIRGFSMVTIDKRPYRRVALELELEHEKEFTLIAAAPLDDFYAGLRNLVFVFSFLIPVCLALAAIVSWVIISFAFQPLKRIIRSAALVSANNLDTKLALPAARDEIRELGRVFNEMLARLSAAFKSQKQFAADASHEIRTPLAIVRSELEYAQRFAGDTRVKESINTSLGEIDRLASLAEGLLMLARLDAGQIAVNLKPVRLNELLLDMLRRVQPLAEKKKITVSCPPLPELVIQADEEKLARILLNILDNAIKFSPVQGNVALSLETQENSARILITDNGPGISEEELGNVFKRFYRSETVRADTEGSGLGLAIAQELIKLQNGAIAVSSEKGGGTRVTIELPING